MQDDYFSFLDIRAAQRRLSAKFARPRWLIIDTLAFVTTMTAIWFYGTVWDWWYYRDNYNLPVLIGVVWSIVLALHGVRHYRRSAAITDKREIAVEDEMRQFIERHGDEADQAALFAMHHTLETDLRRQGRWSLPLMAFGLINALSWVVSAWDIGTSWAFQMTLPFALFVIGGIAAYASWQQRRQDGRSDWFTRLPLSHIAAYGVGLILLVLMSAYRAINSYDAERLIQGWCVVVLLHILLNVVVLPLIQRFQPAKQKAKATPAGRLVLGDDGEVLEIAERDAQPVQTNAR